MTLVHSVPTTGKGTHVLLVGVGAYTHLKDGAGPLAADHFNLGQLTSPPASARALADWFIKEFDCAERGLATVRLVVSEPAPLKYRNPVSGVDHAPGTADFTGLAAAIQDWVAAAQNPEDQLILYYCGHGLDGGVEQLYPLRDFGENPGFPFAKALNLQKLATGLATVRTNNQLLIMDACRDKARLVKANASGGEGFVVARPDDRFGLDPVDQCVIFSTELDHKAQGLQAAPSLCAEALIRALEGAAAKSAGSRWQVKSTLILDAITDLQNRRLLPGFKEQRGDLGRFANIMVRQFTGQPKIPVYISRLGGAPLASAQINCVPTPPKPWLVGPSGPNEWEVALPVGPHSFTANGVPPGPINGMAAPTYLEVRLP